jgi:hypothetical protein
MRKDELRSILIDRGISRPYYPAEGRLPNEKLCLDYENGKLIVYYSERGIRNVSDILITKMMLVIIYCVLLKNQLAENIDVW